MTNRHEATNEESSFLEFDALDLEGVTGGKGAQPNPYQGMIDTLGAIILDPNSTPEQKASAERELKRMNNILGNARSHG
jgi:hypothetical protein